MKHMRYWLSSKRRQMAKLHDLQRQLQAAREKCDALKTELGRWEVAYYNVCEQLNSAARERYQERELRLAAEDRRDVYLEQLANEEE